MTLQNNVELLPTIKKVGCLYLSLVRMVELETGHDFHPLVINSVWLTSQDKGYISRDNMMVHPDRVLKLLINQTGVRLSLAQVGASSSNKETFWLWAKRGKLTDYIYCIEEVRTPGPVGTHFRLCDKNKALIYDSYSFKEYAHTKIEKYTLYSKL